MVNFPSELLNISVQEEISGKYDDIDRIIVVDKEEPLDHKFPYSRHDDDYETKFLMYLHD